VILKDEGPIAQFRLERTPDKREVVGSIPTRPTMLDGGVAQLGERLPCTQEVIGSNPFTSTREKLKAEDFLCIRFQL
jgi:hypothetical protein